MIRRSDWFGLVMVLAMPFAQASATVFTGEIRLEGAQRIETPPSNSSPVVLRYYAPDGSHVKPGEVLLRIDAGQAESQVRKLQAELAAQQAKDAKEIAQLELKASDAELKLADAQAERDTAAVDAALPRHLISALNYDRYQSEMQRTERALAVAHEQADEAEAAVKRRREDGALQQRKKQIELDFDRRQVTRAVVKATRAGTVVHGFDNMFGNGGRYEEGSSSYPGQAVGEVVGGGHDYDVRAWVLEPDRAGLKTGQAVALTVDALPGRLLHGRIRSITGASVAHKDWGDGRYFELAIDLADGNALPLRPGMSVRVDTDPADLSADRPVVADTQPLHADGETFARDSIAISPPAVNGLWQMTVTQMAGDGETVKKGAPVVVFDGSQVMKQLTAKRSELDEKLRKQEQTRLDLADRAREAELATAQARAELEKARRKANQPKEYVAGVEYAKLVIARTKAERRLALTIERGRVAADERRAEQQVADADVEQAKHEVSVLTAALASLTVKAPRAGIVLHQSAWDGNKIDTGSQVWMGQSVAQMPDLSTLAVRASLPERELERVHQGQRVRVVVAGGGDRSVDGTVASVGGTVHSKSRVEAIPVVDLVVTLDSNHLKLKPGQAVRVDFPVDAANSASTRQAP
ncbi:hypothetical protein ATSB10_26030 [Dyella thiooxydans]|uniref:RND efflux pump membrane fusion protein barrel-sandwich domain-containing protein n=1 Tax=Dyella thiooxydans TaxID=445710 RepID=A0A160N324_9GAMM|nr:HlyD family secretion protein [Dyella thiooxydans]AND70057.1 hypothetical protein ATSB10_26030 [Dyella thiooxydans]